MADNDLIILEDAKEAAFTLDKVYRLALLEADLDRMTQLKPSLDEAYDKYGLARLNLMKEGVLATDEDVAQMRQIKAEIDQAASTQSLIVGAVKFVAFISQFV